MDLFRNDIAMTQLPKRIQDINLVCDLLRVQYIWIDEYCIASDNDEETTSHVYDIFNTYKCAFVPLRPLPFTVSRDIVLARKSYWVNMICFVGGRSCWNSFESHGIFTSTQLLVTRPRPMGRRKRLTNIRWNPRTNFVIRPKLKRQTCLYQFTTRCSPLKINTHKTQHS